MRFVRGWGIVVHQPFAPLHISHLDMPALPLDRLYQSLEHLVPFRSIAFSVYFLSILSFLFASGANDHNYARGALCLARHPQLRARGDVDVWNVVIFAEDGDVRDDVHGRDVSCEDHDADG